MFLGHHAVLYLNFYFDHFLSVLLSCAVTFVSILTQKLLRSMQMCFKRKNRDTKEIRGQGEHRLSEDQGRQGGE